MSITKTELKGNLNKIFRRVAGKKEPIVILDKKEPEAVLLDYSVYLNLLEEVELKDHFLNAYKKTRGESTTSLEELKSEYGLS